MITPTETDASKTKETSSTQPKEVQVLVIDNGSGSIKAGFAGDEAQN